MPVPKRKVSKARSRTRKASHRTAPLELRVDSKTGNIHRGHCIDPKTGMYRGKQVETIKTEA
ncbi:MAG: 50S ribosomal protein L32 [Candidatus Methylacidiphilales bacterium]